MIVDLCKGTDDIPVLAMTMKSKADVLVIDDKRDLLSMLQIDKTPIVSSATFLKQLKSY